MSERTNTRSLTTSSFPENGILPFHKVPLFGRSLELIFEKVTGLAKMYRFYKALPPVQSQRKFLGAILDLFQIRYKVFEGDTSQIPGSGGTIVVANHPFGALEGLILAHILLGIRKDVRVLTNEFLGRVTELSDLFFAVDVFSGKQAKTKNMLPIRKAIRWVNDGGILLVFPAGEVSHFQSSRLKITDPEWSESIGRIVRLTQARVVPVYFQGTNNWVFHALGLVHPRLRTFMLPQQLLNKQNRLVELRIGKAIAFHKVRHFEDDRQLTDYLRLRTYTLENPQCSIKKSQDTVNPKSCLRMEPVSSPVNSRLLSAELENLPATQCLTENNGLKVFYAHAAQIPWLLQEIGRLREISFRRTGEGSGKSVDLDLFDDYYLHLFVWNEDTAEVVCAYRMGLADRIVEHYGLKGLYSNSLFKYDHRFLNSITPAIELGRSFVRPEYQRNFSPLMLLWKGIGQFVALNPRYRILFGPVSISNDYETISQQLLVDFLKLTSYDTNLSRLVKPRRPFKKAAKTSWKRSDFNLFSDIDHISELLSQLEKDEKGAPILLKQYLKLGGTILGFNVDNQFCDALDGLIMVDLVKTDPRILRRYMNDNGADKFLKYHEPKFRQVS